jgi:ankyrin repeat protein
MSDETLDGQLFDAARSGDVGAVKMLLDAHPEALQVRTEPYEHTLLHLAAAAGHLASVELLLARGLDVNVREKGDNTYPMHWAAAAGHLDVVRRLADAGGDVIGHGDDHELEVIGWATCWDPCHDDVAEFLVGRGARHHIYSAIAMNLADEVRRIVAGDPEALSRPMSRNEEYQRPLHFAVRKNRAEMVALLLELGADPLATDGTGYPAAVYATGPDIDRAAMELIRARAGTTDLFTALALGEWDAAARLSSENPVTVAPGGVPAGVLHLMAKRNNVAAVKWLLDRGLDPNARWSHWDAVITPLHLAASQGHAEVVRLLLQAGADPRIRDSKHDGDAIGWADFFHQPEIVHLLEAHAKNE